MLSTIKIPLQILKMLWLYIQKVIFMLRKTGLTLKNTVYKMVIAS